jgi:hypothetical protein
MPNSSERAQVSVQRTDANLGHPAKNAERMGHRNWNCPTQAKERLEWATRPTLTSKSAALRWATGPSAKNAERMGAP